MSANPYPPLPHLKTIASEFEAMRESVESRFDRDQATIAQLRHLSAEQTVALDSAQSALVDCRKRQRVLEDHILLLAYVIQSRCKSGDAEAYATMQEAINAVNRKGE